MNIGSNPVDAVSLIGLSNGGTMKMLKINIKMLALFSYILMSAVSVRADEPSNILAAYHNRISQISYSVGSHDERAISLLCQYDPICVYTPLKYEDVGNDSLTKTYFLPRTKCADLDMRYFYDDLHHSLKLLGIDLQISDVKDLHYGVQMSFTMQSHAAYDIVKVIDSDKKMVRFHIIAKI